MVNNPIAELLEISREYGVAVSFLAEMLGVSRPTFYDWASKSDRKPGLAEYHLAATYVEVIRELLDDGLPTGQGKDSKARRREQIIEAIDKVVIRD